VMRSIHGMADNSYFDFSITLPETNMRWSSVYGALAQTQSR
jgi:hypothetical protein